PEGVAKVGNTSVSWDAAGKAVVTFPIPGVPGANGGATPTAGPMTEKGGGTPGGAATEITFSNYPDSDTPLNKDEILYPGKVTERKNGAAVRDLTTDVTETGAVYVVAPVPPTVQKAMSSVPKAPTILYARQEPPTNTSAPTPRIGGHPDLTGNWAEFNIGWIGNYIGNGGRPRRADQERPGNRMTKSNE